MRKNLALNVTNERILILGAGGATRGVVEPLLSLGPTELVIANRTPDRAVNLASLFQDLGAVRGCGFEDVGDEAFDIVINATAAGLTGSVPNVEGTVIASHTVCYDMSYSKSATPFVTWAIEQGCARAHKGWGMLVEQAAESFTLWRGVRPDTEPVLTALGMK
jgi:shikimate dehydrogenase